MGFVVDLFRRVAGRCGAGNSWGGLKNYFWNGGRGVPVAIQRCKLNPPILPKFNKPVSSNSTIGDFVQRSSRSISPVRVGFSWLPARVSIRRIRRPPCLVLSVIFIGVKTLRRKLYKKQSTLA